jgi:hypothetical protein
METEKRNVHWIRAMGSSLGLYLLLTRPYYSVSCALYLYHRFRARYDLSLYNEQQIVVACTSLAMKLEETVKKLADIVQAYRIVVLGLYTEPDPKVSWID